MVYIKKYVIVINAHWTSLGVYRLLSDSSGFDKISNGEGGVQI